MKFLIFSLLLLSSAISFAAGEVESDFDSLGGNKPLLDRAKALEPESNVSIVQNRTVNLRSRWEVAPEYSGTFGGDTYNRTQSVGLNAYYHITPRWAVGLKYNTHFNQLTSEGEAMARQAGEEYVANPETAKAYFPEVDYPKSETMAMLNWAPFYGKINMLDLAVAHFDVYAIAGYGQLELKSGNTTAYTGGGGIGFWFSKNFSTRIEMRYQKYSAKYATGEKDMNLAIAGLQMGWLL